MTFDFYPDLKHDEIRIKMKLSPHVVIKTENEYKYTTNCPFTDLLQTTTECKRCKRFVRLETYHGEYGVIDRMDVICIKEENEG